MRVLLVNPPCRAPVLVPLGLGYIASVLRQKGHTVLLLDLNGEPKTFDELKTVLGSLEYDLIGIGGLTSTYNFVKRFSVLAKSLKPDIKIIAGNMVSTASPELLLRNSEVDICVIDEGEETMVELAEKLKSFPGIEDVRGIVFKKDGHIIETVQRPRIEDLDSLPFPAWDLFPMEIYINSHLHDQYGRRSVNVSVVRGCPFHCIYCSRPFGKQSYMRSAASVIREIKELKNRYRVKHIAFSDDLFMVKRSWVEDICDNLIREDMGITWGAAGRVNLVDLDLLRKMKRAGCVSLGYGFESGSQKILDRMEKGVRIEQAEKAVHLTRKAGIIVDGAFMIGMLGETDQTVRETVDFIKRTGLTLHRFFYTTPYPKTPLYEMAKAMKRIPENEDAYLDSLGEMYNTLAVNLTDMTDEELKTLKEEAERKIRKNFSLKTKIEIFITELRRIFVNIKRHVETDGVRVTAHWFMGKIKEEIRLLRGMRDLIILRNKLKRFLKKNASRKKIVIVNSYDKTDMIAKAIKSSSGRIGKNTTILCFKSRVPENFTDFGKKILLSEDYLDRSDYSRIDDHVFRDISRKWYKEPGEDLRDTFIYRGVELGQVAEYDLQPVLLVKVKALAVIDKVMKAENYEAAFIIDSNRELDSFDTFLKKWYGIPTVLARIGKKISFEDLARRKIASFVSGLIDAIMRLLIHKKSKKLIDAKLFYQLAIEDRSDFLLAPFEKGIRLRLKCLLKNSGYIPFEIGPASSFSLPDYFKNRKNSDIQFLKNRFVFGGIHYWDLIERKIETFIRNDFRRVKRNMDMLCDIQKRSGVKSIILRNDVKELEKTIVLSSKNLGISTLVIQHGITAEPNGHDIVFADKIAVWGGHAAHWYGAFGNDADKFITIGNPGLDKIFNDKDFSRDKGAKDKFGLMGKKRLFTLITTAAETLKLSSFTTDDESANLIKDVAGAVKSIGNANLVVKLHPNQRAGDFSGLITEEERDFVCLVEKTDLHGLLEASDLVIATNSTVVLEAIVMGKPVVIVNLGKRPNLVPYAENNVAAAAYKAEDIAKTIKLVLEDGDIRKKMESARITFIENFLYKADGESGKRILELIKKF